MFRRRRKDNSFGESCYSTSAESSSSVAATDPFLKLSPPNADTSKEIVSFNSKYSNDRYGEVHVDKFVDKSVAVYKVDLPEITSVFKDYLILCKWPDCDVLSNAEDLDFHQMHCPFRIRPCRWMNCKQMLLQKNIIAHEKTCIRRDDTEYVCHFPRCYWRGGNQNLLQHLHQVHLDLLVQETEYRGPAELDSGWNTWYMYVYDELFMCGIGYYGEGDIYYQCQYVGPSVIGEKFLYEFELVKPGTGDTLSFVESTSSYHPGHLERRDVDKYAVNDWVTYVFRVIPKSSVVVVEEAEEAAEDGAEELQDVAGALVQPMGMVSNDSVRECCRRIAKLCDETVL